ncbi:hypothetical protein BpHYR1_008865 [Brachionus plicatilis]|uniref:Uncharacterized protein n=1 Tax=Brachionus plicatilis TaxID=10195 RepID=A0A3M7Q0K2_BRAPC|nr:hypothetical protein BpHYR1_008865 [Brachionus plicatilis]
MDKNYLNLLIAFIWLNYSYSIKNFIINEYGGNLTVETSAYIGGAYCPSLNRVYFSPYQQAKVGIYHYIDCSTDQVETYGNITLADYGYKGATYSPTQNRIYFSPYDQPSEEFWHYIDCETGNLVSYHHNTSIESHAYSQRVYSPNENKIYLLPYLPSLFDNLYYIDCNNGSVIKFTQSSSFSIEDEGYFPTYSAGVFSPKENKIYSIPSGIASSRLWHYINCDMNTILVVQIYLSPDAQSSQEFWHYIDCDTGEFVAYKHNVTILNSPYFGAVLNENVDKIYFVPFGQGPGEYWHYKALERDINQISTQIPTEYSNENTNFNNTELSSEQFNQFTSIQSVDYNSFSTPSPSVLTTELNQDTSLLTVSDNLSPLASKSPDVITTTSLDFFHLSTMDVIALENSSKSTLTETTPKT